MKSPEARTRFPTPKSIQRRTLWFWVSLEKKSRGGRGIFRTLLNPSTTDLKRGVASYMPTSRYLSACPDLDYFRLADNLSGTLVIISQKPVSGELPVRRPAARMRRSFWGVIAAPKFCRARVGINLCSDFNEVAFRVVHHRFVVSVSSYPRTSSYGHSGCAHGSY